MYLQVFIENSENKKLILRNAKLQTKQLLFVVDNMWIADPCKVILRGAQVTI